LTDDVEYLDVEDLIDLAKLLLGDPPPIRDVGLLAAAVARPQATVFGEDAYPDVWTKAAALLESVVNNHALVDGNKRLGWLATAVFLELNAVPITTAANDDVYELVMRVAGGHPPGVEEISERLRALGASESHWLTPPPAHLDRAAIICRHERGAGFVEDEDVSAAIADLDRRR
jgi:death-on-curing protein